MSVRERIREVFLRPQEAYTAPEAGRLLGWTMLDMDAAIDAGELEAARAGSGYDIEWQEVAAMMTAQHPQAVIEEALGQESASVMPELVRLAELRVEIPRYQTVMLDELAGRERISVDEYLSRHLLDLAGSEGEWLGERIPQFALARRWPEA